jgi:radical SAM superfamily enzyme YgiQ (UPF0313 family)
MKALYVHAGMRQGSRDYGIIPMGVVGLMNLLRARGWEIRGIDIPLEISLDPCFELSRALGAGADLAMLDLHWYMNSAGVVDAARTIRAALPEACIVLGGLTASSFDREILASYPEVDLVIRGDAEDALSHLAASLESGERDLSQIPNATFRGPLGPIRSPRTARTGPEAFDALDYVSLDWLDHEQAYYQLNLDGFSPRQPRRYWLEVGRGCFFNCSMCGGGLSAHQDISGLPSPMFRTPERVLDDLAALQRRGVDQVAFSHDIFALNYRGLPALIDGMQQRRISIGMLHEYWRLPRRETIDRIYSTFDPARSEVAISPESGDPVVRKRNFPSKAFDNEELFAVLRHLRNYDQVVEIFFAANLPWETRTSWPESIRVMEQVVANYGLDRLLAYAGFLTIDPMSPMWHAPAKYGIDREFTGFDDYYRMTASGRRKPGYRSHCLSPSEVVQNLKDFERAVVGVRDGIRRVPEPTDEISRGIGASGSS